MYWGTQAIFSYDELYKLDIADCWPLSHIWYPVVFYLIYPVFQKNSYWLPTCKTWSIHIKIKIFFLSSLEKEDSGSIGPEFLQGVSWQEQKPNASFRWGAGLPADLVPTTPSCLSYDGPVSLVFCYLASLIGLLSLPFFQVVYSSCHDGIIHSYEMSGCDCEIYTSSRTGVQADAGRLGWLWAWSSLPCYALLHVRALVCSDLNIGGIDFGFL